MIGFYALLPTHSSFPMPLCVQMCSVLCNQAVVLIADQDFEGALIPLCEALHIAEAHGGEMCMDVARILSIFGQLHFVHGEYRLSMAMFEYSLKIVAMYVCLLNVVVMSALGVVCFCFLVFLYAFTLT
jgi:hypothetical protein